MRINTIKYGILAAMVLGFTLSCAKEDTLEGVVLSASVSEPGTKTMLGTPSGGEYPVLWKTGDKVSINGSLSDNAVTAAQNGEKNVDFTFSASLTAPYKVLYPGTTSAKVISLPASQSYVEGSFDGAAAASWGNATKQGSRYSVKLNNFCSIIRFALNGNATLSKIELKSLGSEKLRGNFTLATDSNGFTGSFSGGTAGPLTYNCSGVTLSNTDTYFYIAIPAQPYASGIEALVYQTDGAFMRLKFWGDGYTLEKDKVVEFVSKTFAAGRTENIIAINNLIAENGGEPTTELPGITVGVYNIKQHDNRSGTNYDYISMDRADVQAGLGSTIVGMGADIFGINEIGEDNLEDKVHDIKKMAIDAGLSSSNYIWKMNYPNKVSRSGNILSGYSYSAIMNYANIFVYNKTTIEVEDDGYVWLCNDENDYWSSMKNAYEHGTGRHTAVWAKCRHKVSGKRFWFIVTHFDTYIDNDDGHNLNNVYSFKTFAQHLRNDEENLPIIAVGDLNFGPKEKDKTTDCPNYKELTSYWTDAYDKVKADGNMTSFYKTYDGTQSGSQHNYYYSFLSFTKNHPDRRLDHIVVKNGSSQRITPISYKTVRRTYLAEDDNAWCPSDHLPVVSYIVFN